MVGDLCIEIGAKISSILSLKIAVYLIFNLLI